MMLHSLLTQQVSCPHAEELALARFAVVHALVGIQVTPSCMLSRLQLNALACGLQSCDACVVCLYSAGPHVCLGMGLFFAEAKMLLALLARDYVIECDHQVMEHDNQTPGAPQQQVGFKVDFNTHLKQGSVRFMRRHEPAVSLA